MRDMNKNVNEHYYINVDNSSKESRQSFLITGKENPEPLFRNYFGEKDSVQIQFNDTSVKNIFVRYYHRQFPLAPAPFSFNVHEPFDYLPDSTFTISINDSSYRIFPQTGFYHFQIDTTEKNGLTLFRFEGNFPGITTPDQMLEAMRFICSKTEYEELKENKNHKAAMDKFWLDVGGSPERTKMLIKKYYTRVQEANRYFTCHTEGWRTDRGMLYIIFGKPNNVYKSSNSENWIYGQPNNILSLNFFFVRVENPFTDNDFTLNRTPIYEGNWYRAVDVWRSGRVYNDN
jgi:GWxTD domain-containing protein